MSYAPAVFVLCLALPGGLACSREDKASVPESTSVATLTNATVSTTPTAPAERLRHFAGRTFSFDYPDTWFLWTQSFTDRNEEVIIASFPPQPLGRGTLPAQAVKIDFSSHADGQIKFSPQEGTVSISFPPSGAQFRVSKDQQGNWLIEGWFQEEGAAYKLNALVTFAAVPLGQLTPVFSSWRANP